MTKLVSFFGLLCCLTACTKPNIDFTGNRAIITGNIVVTDKFAPRFSNFFYDSIVTSGTGYAMVGSYSDKELGDLSAQAFFVLHPPAYDVNATNPYFGGVFDSAVLSTAFNGLNYGDTSQPIQIHAYQVTTLMDFPGLDQYFYNTSNFSTGSDLGSVTKQPNIPTSTLSIKLNNSVGLDFFNKLNTADYDIQSSENFRYYFNGICLKATGAVKCVYGINANLTLRIFYHLPGTTATVSTVDFTNKTNDSYYNRQFSHVEVNRSSLVGNPALQTLLANNREIISTLTHNNTYVQPIGYVGTKITFPGISDLLLEPNFLRIVKAQLYLYPQRASYAGYTPLQTNLLLRGRMPDRSFDNFTAFQGNLTMDYYNGVETFYSFDITAFITKLIASGTAVSPPYELAVLPYSPAITNQFNRVVLGDNSNAQGASFLRITYVEKSN